MNKINHWFFLKNKKYTNPVPYGGKPSPTDKVIDSGPSAVSPTSESSAPSPAIESEKLEY